MNRSQLKTGLKICISIGLLVFFLINAGIDQTLEELSSANLWYVPAGVALYLTSQYVSAYRWQFLCRPLHFNLALREFFDYYLIGMFLSLFLPGAIGGDVGRMYYLAKRCNRKKREALLTLLAERGVGLVAVLMMTSALCLLPVTAPIPAVIRYTMLALSGLALVGYLALLILPVQRLAEKFQPLSLLAQAEIYWKDTPLLVKSVAISFVIQAIIISIQVLIAHALGMEVPFLYLVAVYGIVGLISVIPISFNGIGVREGAYTSLFQFIGIPAETGLAFALYWFLISVLTSLIGGLILVKGHYKTPSMDPDPEMEEKPRSNTLHSMKQALWL